MAAQELSLDETTSLLRDQSSSDAREPTYSAIENGDTAPSNGAATKELARKNISDDYNSLAVIMTVVLVGDLARGIFFPTLSSYVMNMGGSNITQGYAVGFFSFGRVLSSPILGEWSITHGYRSVLIGSCATIALGALVYCATSNIYMLMASQLIMGVGSGTLGVTRAYVADRTTAEQRTYMLAYLTAMQYAGFTVSPLLGSILCKALGEDDPSNFVGGLRWEFTQFTAPGLVLAVCCIITMSLLQWVFTDTTAPVKAPKKKPAADAAAAASTAANAAAAGSGSAPTSSPRRGSITRGIASVPGLSWVRPLDKFEIAIGGGFLLNVATKGTIACYETLGANYAITAFDYTHAQAGLMFSAFGAVGVCSLLSMRWLCSKFNDVQLIVGGLFWMLVSTAMLIVDSESALGYPTFVVSVGLQYALAYPIGHTAVIGLFSKVVGKRPQGALMGWFGSAGSLARMFFPVGAGIIAQYVDINAVFAVLCMVLGVAAVLLVSYRKTYLSYCT